MNKEENPKRFDLKEQTFVFTQRIRGFIGTFADKKIPLAQLGNESATQLPGFVLAAQS